jgi:hypothetical protein
MEGRRDSGWPLIITDVMALVKRAELFHCAFFYGHTMNSLAGVITNMRAARAQTHRRYFLNDRWDPHVLAVRLWRLFPFFWAYRRCQPDISIVFVLFLVSVDTLCAPHMIC